VPLPNKAIPLRLRFNCKLCLRFWRVAICWPAPRPAPVKLPGFTLPLLQRLSSVERVKINGHVPIRALILTPTRELAAQVEESVRIYGKYLKLTSACIFGGVGINPQIRLLKQGVDILVATPGRLLDHMQQNTVDLKTCKS